MQIFPSHASLRNVGRAWLRVHLLRQRGGRATVEVRIAAIHRGDRVCPHHQRRGCERRPDTLDSLQILGTALAYTHRYAEATKLFHDAIEKQGNSNSGGQGNRWSVWYSFACVAVAANHPDDALHYLREAINRGYKNADGLMADDDLKSIRQDPQLQKLIAELKYPPAKAQNQK